MLQLAAVNGEPGQRQLALCLKSCVFFHLTASRWLEWSQRHSVPYSSATR